MKLLPIPSSLLARRGILLLLALAACSPRPASVSPPPPTGSPTATLTPTDAPTQTPYVITATSQAVSTSAASGPKELFVLSMADGGFYHLFAYSPQSQPLTRLTAGDWDDITPALSPDGTQVAFASHRNGFWDLYLLNLQTGQVTRLTDTPEYDGSPSWSPDGAWLVYESYVAESLTLIIRSVKDPAQAPLRLTPDAFANYSPAWSPRGRQIAFVSQRGGISDVWIADLDRMVNDRFSNVSQGTMVAEAHPAWSKDGNQLAWSASDPETGLTGIYVWDGRMPNTPARWAGSGDWPLWQDGYLIATRLTTPNQIFLTGFSVPQGEISLPPVLLPAPIRGITYGSNGLLLTGPLHAAASLTPAALYVPALSPQPTVPGGRASLVKLKNVRAPFPELHDLVDESFQAMRVRLAVEVGWDALGSLENAFIPLTTILDPGMGGDWLYTGRAFTLNPAQLTAGWMAVVREDFGQQTFWRVYLRTNAQDGSRGEPLRQVPWDFAARSGDPNAYEQGGKLMASIPSGYWYDLTALAIQYGWERLPAMTNWRSYFNGARFNEFAMTQGLDWRAAMLELYPPEALVTPTIVRPPTRTPTQTPRWYRTRTPTPTPTTRPTHTP